MTTTTRIFNFSAGPAVLPLEVLEEAQRNLLGLPGVGMSILEISHRSKAFDEVIQGCEADMRTLGKIPAIYKILFGLRENRFERFRSVADLEDRHADAGKRHEIALRLFENGNGKNRGTCGEVKHSMRCGSHMLYPIKTSHRITEPQKHRSI